MKEKALQSIISLYALVAVFKPGKGYTLITNILEIYLSTNFSRQTTDDYLDIFKNKIKEYLNLQNNDTANFKTFFTKELEANCYILTREITPLQRLIALIYLLEYIPYISGKTSIYTTNEGYQVLSEMAKALHLAIEDFDDAFAFCTEEYQKIKTNPLFIITDNKEISIPDVNIKSYNELSGQLIFIKIKSLNTILFKVDGETQFEINDRLLYKRRTYILNEGAIIRTENGLTFFYNDIAKALYLSKTTQNLSLEAKDVTYKFSNGHYGLQQISFRCNSGEILAIMGGSGSGKTTLMNLLIGARKPTTGKISLNGIDVFSNPEKVKGYIGYVPQDDALNEELTAFENLYYIAGLSSKNLTKEEKTDKVNSILSELNLSNIRNLKVGNPLEKIISGGQRKRLNIAIELIREPGILFLDEPTSGLSSADSENIMHILKSAARKGKMIVLNIHQPSSDIYKQFDKLLFIDQGGYPVYYGHAMQVTTYLKTALQLVDAQENECQKCGNLNPDEIFHLVNIDNIPTPQRTITSRLFPPKRWHRRFIRVTNETKNPEVENIEPLQPQQVNIPNVFVQFGIHSVRNLLTKIADYPYLVLSIFLPPILALLLSVFSRYISPNTGTYSYHDNENIPPFIFMSVIVAMFVGIMSGSPEIIKDRKALKRESFLDLSFIAYILAKLSFLIVLAGIQMISYVAISKWVLQIPSGIMPFAFLMCSTAISASIMGLLLSAVFKTIATVYVSIPFLLIPQILFSGAVIDFNKINPLFTSKKHVPPISEIMVSRWVFEAISVSLYQNSEYSNEFYSIEKSLSDGAYHRNFLIPELEKAFYKEQWSTSHYITPDSTNYQLVVNGINKLDKFLKQDNSDLYAGLISGSEFSNYIRESRRAISDINDSVQNMKDSKIRDLGIDDYNRIQQTMNKKSLQVMTDEANTEKIRVRDNDFIRKISPIYNISDSKIGLSHLYASHKKLINKPIPTPAFNLGVIWLMSLTVLIFVIYNKPKL